MMRSAVATAVVVFGLGVGVGHAQGPIPNVNDGTALQRECETALLAADDGPDAPERDTAEPGDDIERGYHMGQCLGLVSAVWHTHMLMVEEFDGRDAFCPRSSISTGEMARIVSRYLQVNPAELGEWDTVLILRAFIAAYPCG